MFCIFFIIHRHVRKSAAPAVHKKWRPPPQVSLGPVSPSCRSCRWAISQLSLFASSTCNTQLDITATVIFLDEFACGRRLLFSSYTEVTIMEGGGGDWEAKCRTVEQELVRRNQECAMQHRRASQLEASLDEVKRELETHKAEASKLRAEREISQRTIRELRREVDANRKATILQQLDSAAASGPAPAYPMPVVGSGTVVQTSLGPEVLVQQSNSLTSVGFGRRHDEVDELLARTRDAVHHELQYGTDVDDLQARLERLRRPTAK